MYRSARPWTLGIQGFKSVGRYQQLRLSPLTVLLGPNSAGKSAILEALRILASVIHAADGRSVAGWPKDGEHFERLAHDGKTEAGLRLRLDVGSVSPGLAEPWNELKSLQIEYRAEPWVAGSATPRNSLVVEDESGFIVRLDPYRFAWNTMHPVFESVVSPVQQALERDAGHPEGVELAVELFAEAMQRELGYHRPWRTSSQRTRSNPRYEEDDSTDAFLGAFVACELAVNSSKTHAVIARLVAEEGLTRATEICGSLEAESDAARFAADVDGRADIGKELEAAVLEMDRLVERRRLYERAVGETRRRLDLLLSDLQTLVPTVQHEPPMREAPPRLVHVSKDALDAAGRAAESVNSFLGSDRLASGYRFEREPLVRSSDAALSPVDAYGSMASPATEVPLEQYLLDLRSGQRLGFEDVGFGISQVMPVLIALADHHRGSPPLDNRGILQIEQPEAHLHPALHADLADEMIRAARRGREGAILMAETHSEHLVLRLLRRIRETTLGTAPSEFELRPEDLTLAFVDRIDGDVQIRHVRVSEDGAFLDPWPYGFFPERLDELE